jgi:hypothetical protein
VQVEGSKSKKKGIKEIDILEPIRGGIIYKIKISDYIMCDLLNESEQKELTDNAIRWMKQEGIDPSSEGYDEGKSIEENYTAMYNIMSDNPIIFYKRDYNLDVKNISE